MLSILISVCLAGWQDDAAASTAAAAVASPELVTEVASWQPATTRSGHFRFLGEHSHDPRLTPLMLHRLATGDDSEAVRVAIVEAVARQKGEGAVDALHELALSDHHAAVRAVAVESLRKVGGDLETTTAAALGDPAWNVRESAARSVAWADLPSLSGELVTLLDDPAPEVRAAAARSLGTLRQAETFTALLPLLDDTDPYVRLQALHALERVDADEAARLSQLSGLADDPDPKVARAATALIR